MKYTNNITKILSKHDDLEQKSLRWLQQRINTAITKGFIHESLVATSGIHLGAMYTYAYWPKGADTLDYFDVNPLIIPINKYDNGFLGLNLHYIPKMTRKMFLSLIDKYATGKGLRQRYQITYELMTTMARLTPYTVMIHRYLYTHLRTPPIQIHPTEYQNIIQLPNVKFYGVNSMDDVYSEMLDKMIDIKERK